MIGDPGVGKSTLFSKYTSPLYHDDENISLGVDFSTKRLELNRKKVLLQFWMFRGEERFRFLLTEHVKGANGPFILNNITNRNTLDHLPDWLQILREHAGDIPIILVGNKIDWSEQRQVSSQIGEEITRKKDLGAFIECSAKTGENVKEIFETLTRLMLQRLEIY